jgi:hypothetical protein
LWRNRHRMSRIDHGNGKARRSGPSLNLSAAPKSRLKLVVRDSVSRSA